MRLIFYIFILSQLFNLLEVLAEKFKKEPSDTQIKWERIDNQSSKHLIVELVFALLLKAKI